MIDKLNERITIQQSKHMTDKVGNHRNAWVDYYTGFAYMSSFACYPWKTLLSSIYLRCESPII